MRALYTKYIALAIGPFVRIAGVYMYHVNISLICGFQLRVHATNWCALSFPVMPPFSSLMPVRKRAPANRQGDRYICIYILPEKGQ